MSDVVHSIKQKFEIINFRLIPKSNMSTLGFVQSKLETNFDPTF